MQMFNACKCFRRFLIVGVGAVLLMINSASADDPRATPEELSALPDWCESLPKIASFTKKSNGCAGLHHYCWALVWEKRGNNSRSVGDKLNYYYDVALGDLKYALDASSPGCIMFPVIYMKSGDFYSRVGQYLNAIGNYRQAIEADSKLVLAYSGMSKAFVIQGLLDKAIAVLEEGLKANPNNKLLKDRLEYISSLQN